MICGTWCVPCIKQMPHFEQTFQKAGPELAVIAINACFNFKAQEPGGRQPVVLVFPSPWCESYLSTSRPGLSANCRAVREQVDKLAKGLVRAGWASPRASGHRRTMCSTTARSTAWTSRSRSMSPVSCSALSA